MSIDQLEYFDWGGRCGKARIGFCFNPKQSKYIEIDDNGNSRVCYLFDGPYALLKTAGSYPFSIDQARTLRDYLNDFIEMAENA